VKKFGINQTKVASRIARGPGSMFGEADAHRAAQDGDYDLAVKLALAHNREMPPEAPRIDAWIIDAWRSYATEPK
jgi:hypothetical protein